MLVFSSLPISRTELKFSRPPRMPSLLSFPISQKHIVFITCWPNGVRNMCTTKLRCFSLRSNIYDFCLWMDGAYFQELKKHCEIFVLIINFIIWQNCSQRDDKCSCFFHSRVDYLQGETKDTVC